LVIETSLHNAARSEKHQNITVNLTPYSLVDGCERFGWTCRLQASHITLKMELVRSSGTVVPSTKLHGDTWAS